VTLPATSRTCLSRKRFCQKKKPAPVSSGGIGLTSEDNAIELRQRECRHRRANRGWNGVTNEILSKIATILESREPNESSVVHLCTLARKLIEGLESQRKQDFALLAFYPDWTVHRRIDRSPEGVTVVEKMNAIIGDHLKRKDSSAIPGDLTRALSLDNARTQLDNLIRVFDPQIKVSVDHQGWQRILFQLMEIVSHCPLKIDATRKRLKPVRERIEATPIKDKAIVERVAIVKVPATILYPRNAGSSHFLHRAYIEQHNAHPRPNPTTLARNVFMRTKTCSPIHVCSENIIPPTTFHKWQARREWRDEDGRLLRLEPAKAARSRTHGTSCRAIALPHRTCV